MYSNPPRIICVFFKSILILTYIYIHIQTCIHTYRHVYIHTYRHVYIHTYRHVYIQTCIHTHMYTNIHIHKITWKKSLNTFYSFPLAHPRLLCLSRIRASIKKHTQNPVLTVINLQPSNRHLLHTHTHTHTHL